MDRLPNHFEYILNRCKKSLEIMAKENFFPIAISYFFFEEVYIFNEEQEALKAFEKFEKLDKKIYAWWYSKDTIKDEINNYCTIFNSSAPYIYDLKNEKEYRI